MKRINVILILLLAINVVAGSVSPPAARAAAVSGTGSDLQGSLGATAPATVGGGSLLGTTGVTGDPGGAGDGLGATPDVQGTDAAKNFGAGAVVDFLFQVLRLMWAVVG